MLPDSVYYDGSKLLGMLDEKNEKPEIYICTSNRTAGKTFYFGRLLINRFKKTGKKFCLLYRYAYEISDVADKFFSELNRVAFPNDEMTEEMMCKGAFCELRLNGESCGYSVSLNKFDTVKKYSHIFADVDAILFDEFQPENNRYLPKEVEKFISIHTSIARGGGKQVRYVPVYMVSNPNTILNPYYMELGISTTLRKNQKFMRGNGFVLEQGKNESAAEAQRTSKFNQAFSGNDYVGYAAESVYLSDDTAFIEKPSGMGIYLFTIRYNGKDLGVYQYPKDGILYCNGTADLSCPDRIAVTTEDMRINYVLLEAKKGFLQYHRKLFQRGAYRFKNQFCKEAVMKMVSYL